MEQFVGQLMLFGGNFAPVGWLACEGQILQISDYEVLYTLIGTTYGGDGQTTFALPDLRGRVPNHAGTGRGLSPAIPGQMTGTETSTMTLNQMPSHVHVVNGNVKLSVNGGDQADSETPIGNYLKQTPNVNTYAGTANAAMGASTLTISLNPDGGGAPFENIQPSLAMFYCIATVGVWPSQQ